MSTLVDSKIPNEAKNLPVSWFKLVPSNSKDTEQMLCAFAVPKGTGVFPTVIILHGSHGFAKEYVQLALDFAKEGILAVAVAWFQGSVGAGVRFVSPIKTSIGPEIPDPSSPEGVKIIDSIIQCVSEHEKVDSSKVGIFGHSRGGRGAINYLLNSKRVKAVAVNSSGYTREFINNSEKFNTPILILHGLLDNLEGGGSENTDIKIVQEFEETLKILNKNIQSKYYEHGGHNSFFTNNSQYLESVKIVTNFFLAEL